MTVPAGLPVDRATYRGRSPAIRVQAGPVLDSSAHAYPQGADLTAPAYRGRGKPIRVGMGASPLDDFNGRTTGADLGCTSRSPHYKYQDSTASSLLWVDSIHGIYTTPGPNPLTVENGYMKLALPAGCFTSAMSAKLWLPITKTDEMTIEFDFRSVAPDFIPPDGVLDGYGTQLNATLGLGLRHQENDYGLGIDLGELVQVYSYPDIHAPDIFRQFAEFDQGDPNIDFFIDLAHAFEHRDFARGVHFKQQSHRLDGTRVQVDTTVSTIDGAATLNEYVASTTEGATYAAPVASRTFTHVEEDAPAGTTDYVEFDFRGRCDNGGGNVIAPYDGFDLYWMIDNFDVTTNDWNDTVVPTC